jgi:trehalose-phosphatase
MEQLGVKPSQAIYVGDDVTDEAAFRRLQDAAAAVVVQETPRPTAAVFRVADVAQVHEFLDRLASSLPEQET